MRRVGAAEQPAGDGYDVVGHRPHGNRLQRVGEARDAHVEPRGEHNLAALRGIGAPPGAVEYGDVAVELTERDAQGVRVERVLLSPAQQAGPEGDLPPRHGDVIGHLGDGDAPDGVAEFWIPLKVGERRVDVVR